MGGRGQRFAGQRSAKIPLDKEDFQGMKTSPCQATPLCMRRVLASGLWPTLGPWPRGKKRKDRVGCRPTGRRKPRLQSCVASAQTSPRQASSCVSIPHHTSTQHRVKAFLGRLAQTDPPSVRRRHEGRSPAAARQSQVLATHLQGKCGIAGNSKSVIT